MPDPWVELAREVWKDMLSFGPWAVVCVGVGVIVWKWLDAWGKRKGGS
jgi:hypothetical protein